MKYILEPKVDVKIRRQLLNNKWTTKAFKNISLEIEPGKPKICVLVIGKTAQKTKIDITYNIKAVHKSCLETDGKFTLEFITPPIHCLLSVSDLSDTNKIAMKEMMAILQFTNNGNSPYAVIKETRKNLRHATKNDDRRIWCSVKRSLNLSTNQCYLSVLSLEGNELNDLPKEIALLGLKELRLNQNNLGSNRSDWWLWLDGRILRTIQIISMDHNKICQFPSQIVRCSNLTHLSLASNELESVPAALFSRHGLLNLQHIWLSDNLKLASLPGIYIKLQTLDISGCIRLTPISHPLKSFQIKENPGWRGGLSLLEAAGQAVIMNHVPYELALIPRMLKMYLNNASFCHYCHSMVPTPRCLYKSQIPLPRVKVMQIRASNLDSLKIIEGICYRCYPKPRN